MAQTLPTNIWHSLAEIPPGYGPTVATIGNFDGVHLGHRDILTTVINEARERNAKSVAITFDPHPERLLRPDRAPKLLTPIEIRTALLAATGLDAILILPFDAAMAQLSARTFVQQVLVDRLHTFSLHEGANFRCGYRAEAGILELTQIGSELGFSVTIHPAVHTRGIEVSSSAIRAYLTAGQLPAARRLLGRPFSIHSTQQRDRGIGTRLLVPTINLAAYSEQLPANGVYITRITIAGRTFQSVTNIGMRPTFEAGFAIESHILNFEPLEIDPSAPIELAFLLRLRDEHTFPTPAALKSQILHDVARAQRYFRRIA